MVVEILSVGTEILMGNIVNTNAAYLAEQCAMLGLICYYQTVVGDNEERMELAMQTAISRSDVILVSGGLGPTQDDLTKEIAAKVCNRRLYEDPRVREAITVHFQARNMEITNNNWKQALVPEGGIVVPNENGTAPGLIIEEQGKVMILLPGPPGELVPMFETKIFNYLQRISPDCFYSRMIKICGVGESKAETMVKDLMDSQTNPTIAPYAKTGEVHFRVTAKATSEEEAERLMKPVVKEFKSRFGNSIYTTDPDVTLSQAVVELLHANNLTVSTVESCTGGMLASALISVPGVSEVFKAGSITYSNKAKRKMLEVKKGTIHKHGVVSAEVAREMAVGASHYGKADVVVAITGNAGPSGVSEQSEVGLVYIACNIDRECKVKEYHFRGNRQKIRENATVAALILLRQCILEYYSKKTFHE